MSHPTPDDVTATEREHVDCGREQGTGEPEPAGSTRATAGTTGSPDALERQLLTGIRARTGLLLLTLLAVTGFGLLLIVTACGGLSRYGEEKVATSAEWHPLRLDNIVTIAVPPDAQAQDVQPIDSIFGILRGDGYEIIYDYGRFGEQLATYEDQLEYTRRTRRIDGRIGNEISFRPDAKPWGIVRILQVQDGTNQLTIRVSCVNDDTCRLATDLFNSIRFTSG